MVDDLVDPRRTEPSFELGEREMYEAWLDFHRMTLLLKCEGLADHERKARPIPTSKLSLHGLVRHMAEVERHWFRRVLLNDGTLTHIWDDPQNDDADLFPLDDARWEDDLATWEHECAASRAAALGRALDAVGTHREGPCTLRWIYAHMTEEYARHNGHADLIRELVDGRVGW